MLIESLRTLEFTLVGKMNHFKASENLEAALLQHRKRLNSK